MPLWEFAVRFFMSFHRAAEEVQGSVMDQEKQPIFKVTFAWVGSLQCEFLICPKPKLSLLIMMWVQTKSDFLTYR